MSDLWERAREALRQRLSDEDWRRSIAPLRTWIAHGVLYLWVDRAPEDWRVIPNPAKDFDREIRETVRRMLGRPLEGARYLDRPPNREHMLNERRRATHRARAREQQDRTTKKLLAYAKEECRRLLANPPNLASCRSDAERRVKLEALAMDRAKRRLRAEALSSGARAGRGEPSDEPPPWPPLPPR